MGIQGKSLNIMVPMYDAGVKVNFLESFLKLLFALAKYNVPFSWSYSSNESLVTRARNRLADRYMKEHDQTHALLIDSDIGFEPLDILAMLEHDLDIVGAACVKKNIRWDRVQAAVKASSNGGFTSQQLATIAGDFIFNFDPTKRTHGDVQFNTGKPLEVYNLGTGLMMVRRDVFEGIKEKFPERWYDSQGFDPADLPGPVYEYFRCGINPETKFYDSEDYWFCVDARAAGFRSWVLPWMKTSHFGNYTYRGDLPAVAQLAGRL